MTPAKVVASNINRKSHISSVLWRDPDVSQDEAKQCIAFCEAIDPKVFVVEVVIQKENKNFKPRWVFVHFLKEWIVHEPDESVPLRRTYDLGPHTFPKRRRRR